jgi:hypothetical protein
MSELTTNPKFQAPNPFGFGAWDLGFEANP